MKKYLPRYTDYELKESLEYMGAVLITGPKWCGKTTTAKQQCNSLKRVTASCLWKILFKTCRHKSYRIIKR